MQRLTDQKTRPPWPTYNSWASLPIVVIVIWICAIKIHKQQNYTALTNSWPELLGYQLRKKCRRIISLIPETHEKPNSALTKSWKVKGVQAVVLRCLFACKQAVNIVRHCWGFTAPVLIPQRIISFMLYLFISFSSMAKLRYVNCV